MAQRAGFGHHGIERNVTRVATGWEAELRIAVGDLIPFAKMLDLCEAFYEDAPETQLRLSSETLGGLWDALVSGRADLVIGAPGDGPSGGGYAVHALGRADFIFVVAPHHPLADAREPLSNDLISRYRAVAVADSSRGLLPRTFGLLAGQRVLTVPDMAVKRDAHIRGMGVGYMPRHLIDADIAAGRLLVKDTEDGSSTPHLIYYAWRTRHHGKALSWFKRRLWEDGETPDWFST